MLGSDLRFSFPFTAIMACQWLLGAQTVGRKGQEEEGKGGRKDRREKERKIALHSPRPPTANGRGQLCEEMGLEGKIEKHTWSVYELAQG